MPPPSNSHGIATNPIIIFTKMVATLLLIIPLMSEYTLGIEVFTNHFLVHLNEPGIHNAHKVAKRNGFINRGPLLGSDSEYHFVQPALSHARTRRSIGHHTKLARDPHVRNFLK
ncbi:unnamed protein product [Meloidogyne enterolobii]|uniref:Uncharacterized protein n=1 Tax=Meloidogyne enterolobii TaxID=390850 RepID=A0ACB0XZL1_MELEN